MEKLGLELFELKHVYDYISEAVLICDKDHNIVFANKRALSLLSIDEEDLLYTKLTNLIPLEYQNDILETIKDDELSYFDIYIKNSSNSLLSVHVSGQKLPLKDDEYGLLTIVDTSAMMEKEEKQIKALKSQIITKSTTLVKKQSEIKGEKDNIILNLQDNLEQFKHENFKLERKISLFEKENKVLNKYCEKILEDSFTFEYMVDREVAMAKRFGNDFSLAIVAIDDYESFSDKVGSESKKSFILRAFKRHFKSTVRRSDVIYYADDGVFYLILANAPGINITTVLNRLLQSKRIDTDTVVTFNYGISHFHKEDNYDYLLYRAQKNLEENIKNKKFITSKKEKDKQ